MEVKSFIKPTTIVRSIMQKHGAPKHMIWTNRYEKCKTVKCYIHNLDTVSLAADISEVLEKSGVNGFHIKNFNRISFIVRIPLSEQPI